MNKFTKMSCMLSGGASLGLFTAILMPLYVFPVFIMYVLGMMLAEAFITLPGPRSF